MLGLGGLAECKQEGEVELYQKGLANFKQIEQWIDSILRRYNQRSN